MATSNGTNATTGQTNTDGTEEAKKAAALAAKTAQANAAKLDKRLSTTLASAEKSLNNLAEAIAAAKDGDVWKHVTDAEGKPFKSWQKYLTDRLSAQPLMHKVVRNAVIKELVDAGVSIRAAAEATGVSVGTAAGVAKEGREARPGGDTAGVAPTASQTASKAVTQAINAAKRVKDTAQDMSDTDLKKLDLELTETVNILRGLLNLRQAAVNQKISGSVSDPGVAEAIKANPAPSPATVAKQTAKAS